LPVSALTATLLAVIVNSVSAQSTAHDPASTVAQVTQQNSDATVIPAAASSSRQARANLAAWLAQTSAKMAAGQGPDTVAQLVEGLSDDRVQRALAAATQAELEAALYGSQAARDLLAALVDKHANVAAIQKVLGDAAADLVFTPITPCRVMDTRGTPWSAAAPLTASTTRDFDITNGLIASQGGVSTGICGVPMNARAISVDIIVNSPAAGWLYFWPNGAAQPNATVLNFNGTSTGYIANAAVLSVFPSGPAARIQVQPAGTTGTQVIMDVLGYFAPPANVGISGNITLVNPSTATTGNIMKGANRFIHNYGTQNTFIGENAGNFTLTGTFNIGSGYQALYSNTTGYNNTANGGYALTSNTTGYSNTASGTVALNSNTTGNNNTASGFRALYYNTTGVYNTADGVYALFNNTAGYQNTASGASALYGNTTGSANTASGESALHNNTTGNNNIAVGYGAGNNLTTGDFNIDIGNWGAAAEGYTIRIGDSQTRAFISGIRGVTTGAADAIPVIIDSFGQLGTASSSRRFKDDIADMSKASAALMKLRPVTFHYKSDQNPKGRTLQYGLIAEEVADVYPGLVAHSADGQIETVMYQFLPAMLLNEYQKQQRTIEAQAAMVKQQVARIEEQSLEIVALKQQAAKVAALEQLTAKMVATLDRLQRTGMTTAGLELK
jgi:hypothetical protein